MPQAIDSTQPTVILIHGYMGDSKKPWVQSMTQRLHQLLRVNVCKVDWSTLAALDLNLSVLKLRDVGQRIGQCVRRLVGEGEDALGNLSIVGYGLGAHLAGCAGKNLSGQVGRIFGLDPMVEFSKELLSDENRLTSRDARLVQVAHTSIGTYGTFRPCGDQDFYFNHAGQSPQPGCPLLQESYRDKACSHFRAVEYFFHSLNKTNEFWDVNREEMFGYYTKGSKGTFLVKTNNNPPYV